MKLVKLFSQIMEQFKLMPEKIEQSCKIWHVLVYATLLSLLGFLGWPTLLKAVSESSSQRQEAFNKLEGRVVELEKLLDFAFINITNLEQALLEQSEQYLLWKSALEENQTEFEDRVATLKQFISNVSNDLLESIHILSNHVSILDYKVKLVGKIFDINENNSSLFVEEYKTWKSSLEDSHNELQENIRKANLFEFISNISLSLQDTKDRLSPLQQQVTSGLTQVRTLEGRLSETTIKFNSWRATIATDIRLANLETAAVWRGPGYNDQYGFVITEVSNWNRDNLGDMVGRRRIQKLVNGNWVNI